MISGIAAALLLGGCVSAARTESRLSTATDIAAPATLQKRVVEAGGFPFTVYEKITAPGQSASLYIEGDGSAWMTRTRPSADPTPSDPVALRLAALDPAPNVIYIARPCQYTRGPACDIPYWTHRRFAPELVTAMDSAITTLTPPHRIKGLRLVGYSGGGTMAALLAARRTDVIDLRTVAGNLDHRAQSRLLDVSALDGSLNPPDDAARLRLIPQQHFIGGDDKIVPHGIYDSYAATLQNSPCLHASVLPGITHDGDDWVAQWPRLLRQTPACTAP